MTLAQLEEQLRSGRMAPVYFVYGPEEFLRREGVRLVKDAAAGAKPPMDLAEIDAAQADPRKLLDDLRTPSLFAPRRLVIIENAEALLGDALPLLVDYARKPSSRATLLLVAQALKTKVAKKAGTRRKKGKADAGEAVDAHALLKHVEAVECPTLTRRDLPGWILARAQALGKRMEPAAARLLMDLAGEDLGPLNERLHALVTLCGKRPRITTDDVTQLVGNDAARKIWDLTAATMERNAATAMRTLESLLRYNEAPIRIISFLATEIRKMCVIKRLAQERRSPREMEQLLGMQGWMIERAMRQAANVTEAQLRQRLRLCVQADYDSKTGAGDETWIIEQLVLRLCGM